MPSGIQYNRLFLLSLNKQTTYWLPPPVISRLCCYELLSSHVSKDHDTTKCTSKESKDGNRNGRKTRRGKRGGRKKKMKRRIKVVINAFDRVNTSFEHTALERRQPSLLHIPIDNRLSTQHNNNKCHKCIKGGLLNARSVTKKETLIENMIVVNDFDFFIITETWLKNNDNKMIPRGYNFIPLHRKTGRGGGIYAIYKESLKLKKNRIQSNYNTFESLDMTLTSEKNENHRIIVIYRPPPSHKNKFTHNQFFDELDTLALEISTTNEEIVMLGDFNVHVDDITDANCLKLKDILESHNLGQYVKDETHTAGHILDLVISRKDNTIIDNVEVLDRTISDHNLIAVNLKIDCKTTVKKRITYRKTKSLNTETFEETIESLDLFTSINNADSVHEMVDFYNNSLKAVFDELCPLITKEITIRPNTEWYCDKMQVMKHQLRSAERTWRRSKLEINRQIFMDLKNQRNQLISSCKSEYLKNKITCAKQNPRELFAIMNKLIKDDTSTNNFDDPIADANRFSLHFSDKISRIRNELDNQKTIHTQLEKASPLPAGVVFDEFEPATDEEVLFALRQCSKTTCPLDPIPSWLVLSSANILVPVLTHIVNASLFIGEVSNNLKHAIITPILKKSSLDKDDPNNYRPVSNLTLMSKLIEKIVAFRLNAFLNEHKLFSKFQSAYNCSY